MSRSKALELFKGPFRYDKETGYVRDADGKYLCDVLETLELNDGIAVAVGKFIAAALTEKFKGESCQGE